MAGAVVDILWHGRRARAWLPEPLGDAALPVSVSTARRTERAAAAVVRSADRLPPTWEPLARLLLRAEGVASSSIEGVRAPLADVAVAEVDEGAVGGAAPWIADNLAAVSDALEEAQAGRLSVRALHGWHVRLMRHGLLDRAMVGAFRDAQGWIGGTSPLDAVFVPPPPEAVPGLMRDLVAFINRADVDPITRAAVAHAQFETIHPYGDGNGRIGRILVGWILVRRLAVRVPPPVSVLVARDPGGYLSGLQLYRDGDLDRWVAWFANVVAQAAEATIGLLERIGELLADWRGRVGDLRSDAAARGVIELLPSHPVVSAALVAESVGVSERAARTALEALAERGIIEPFDVKGTSPGRPRHWWLARSLVDLVAAWSG